MFNPLTQSPMARFIFSNRHLSVIETENTYTVWDSNGETFGSAYLKSNSLAMFAAINDARTRFSRDMETSGCFAIEGISQVDYFDKLKSDLYEINQIKTWPYPIEY